jgi:hypothetical protein
MSDSPLSDGGSAPSPWRQRMNPDCRTWNLACLEGSAKGYARGTVSLLRVRTWTQRVLRLGASPDDVRRLLSPYGLELTGELTVEARHEA